MRHLFLFFLFIFTFQACSDDPRCNDGVLNGNEIDIDCGGNCDPCYTCSDGILNQGEFDVDCGGPCPSCDNVRSWKTLALPGENPVQIHFFDKQEGILLTDTKLWRTSDQGDTWDVIDAPSVIGHFYWMKVINDQLAFALVIESGIANYRLYKITDRFNNWETIGLNLPTDDPNNRSIYDIDAKDENNILVSHEHAFGQVYLSRTTDGGNSWNVILDSQDIFPFNLEFIAGLQYNLGNTIYAFHERDQLISTDNGATWTKRELPFEINVRYSPDNRQNIPYIRYSDENNAVFNSSNHNDIWLTTDSGLSWNQPSLPNLNLTDWTKNDYLKLEDGRQLMLTYLSCLELQNGYCSIAWISDSEGQNWDRLGLTPGLDSQPWSELETHSPFYFDEVVYALDLREGFLLRLR